MLRDYLNYRGSSPHDNWIKIVDPAYETLMGGSVPPNSYWWNIAPDDVNLKEDLCVHVISEDPAKNRLPPFVRESAGIVYLHMPLRFIPYLRPGDIPPSVRTLVLVGEGHCEISPEIDLHHVERLHIGRGEFIFERRNFPDLRDLPLQFDRKRTMLNRIATFENLAVLGIQPCSASMFSVLARLHLSFVRLNNSRSETLEGIESLEHLTDLWLHSWTNLTDLSPLAQLPSLEDLTLTYCKRITNAVPLAAIPRLRRLFAWQCKNKAIEALVPRLSTRNLEELSVS